MAAASNARPVPAPVIALGSTSDDNPTMTATPEMSITTTASGTRVRSCSTGAKAQKCKPMTKVHSLIEWGFIQSRPTSVSGIGPRTSHVVHEALWEPHKDQVAGFGYLQDPRRFPEFVLDVYGVQVLNPGHNTVALEGDWDVQDLSHDRKLVSSRDPAAWFADPPSLDTLLAARESFGSLVDPIWSPLEN